MNNLKVGDPVEVLGPGLLMMQALMKKMGEDVGPMNIGTIAEIWDDGTILVQFPIGSDNPEEHSQSSPYPPHMVRLRSAVNNK